MNERLKEIWLSFKLNQIDQIKSKDEYKNIISILGGLTISFGEDYYNAFNEILSKSINDRILDATDKELFASMYINNISPTKLCSLMKMNYQRFSAKYGDTIKGDFINGDYLDSLIPLCNTQIQKTTIDLLSKFIYSFDYPLGNKEHDLKDFERTLELEFLLIYNKLSEVLTNELLLNKFIFTVCNNLNINYSVINILKSNIHYLNRTYPSFTYNNRYLKQEITTLYVHKGLKKGTIGSQIFCKNSSYLYSKGTISFGNVIDKNDIIWQYIPTLKWDGIDKEEVQKFIDVFHYFIRLNE